MSAKIFPLAKSALQMLTDNCMIYDFVPLWKTQRYVRGAKLSKNHEVTPRMWIEIISSQFLFAIHGFFVVVCSHWSPMVLSQYQTQLFETGTSPFPFPVIGLTNCYLRGENEHHEHYCWVRLSAACLCDFSTLELEPEPWFGFERNGSDAQPGHPGTTSCCASAERW